MLIFLGICVATAASIGVHAHRTSNSAGWFCAAVVRCRRSIPRQRFSSRLLGREECPIDHSTGGNRHVAGLGACFANTVMLRGSEILIVRHVSRANAWIQQRTGGRISASFSLLRPATTSCSKYPSMTDWRRAPGVRACENQFCAIYIRSPDQQAMFSRACETLRAQCRRTR